MQRTQRIREICKELPDSCSDYFFAISQTTSALTRLAYAYDLRLFFQYLTLEQAAFAGVDPRLITIEQIGAISRRNMYKIDGQETGRLSGEEIGSVTVEFADGSMARLSGRQLLRAVAAGMTHLGIPVSSEVVRLVPEEK